MGQVVGGPKGQFQFGHSLHVRPDQVEPPVDSQMCLPSHPTAVPLCVLSSMPGMFFLFLHLAKSSNSSRFNPPIWADALTNSSHLSVWLRRPFSVFLYIYQGSYFSLSVKQLSLPHLPHIHAGSLCFTFESPMPRT